MVGRRYFIYEYLKTIYDKELYYIGFFTNKDTKKPLIEDEKNNINIIESNMKENKDKKENENENTIIENDVQNGEKSEEKTQDETQINEINMIKNGDEPKESQNKNNELKKIRNEDYKYYFGDCNFHIIIFEINDGIFGEDIKYVKEEYNLLYNITNDVGELKKNVNDIDLKINGIKENYGEMNNKLDKILDELKKK